MGRFSQTHSRRNSPWVCRSTPTSRRTTRTATCPSRRTTCRKSLEKLSSGLRINRAADDAAGLAISEGLRSQVGGLTVAARNAQDGISVIQTAEGALTEVHSILQRVRDLAVQAGNDSNNADSRTAITDRGHRAGQGAHPHRRVDELQRHQAARRQRTHADVPGRRRRRRRDDQIAVDLGRCRCTSAPRSPASRPPASPTRGRCSAHDHRALDTQITAVSTARAELGASQNRFESTIKSLNVSKENLSAAESRIRDTDMAEEMVKYTRSNVLSQAGTAMLAQANQSNQGVLQLLR